MSPVRRHQDRARQRHSDQDILREPTTPLQRRYCNESRKLQGGTNGELWRIMANYGELCRRFLWRIGPNSTAQFAIIRQNFDRSTIDLESFFCTDRLS